MLYFFAAYNYFEIISDPAIKLPSYLSDHLLKQAKNVSTTAVVL